MSVDLYQLPQNIPAPVDDHACEHLPGILLPSIALPSTIGGPVDLSQIAGRIIIYAYPRTGVPNEEPIIADWDNIPGARGCTPQSCGFRDYHTELLKFVANVFGLSTQDVAYQREMVKRLQLPFPILSDVSLEFTKTLRLPTFTVANTILLKRLTLIIRNGVIEKVFYPVFPPDKNAEEVIDWLKTGSNPLSPSF